MTFKDFVALQTSDNLHVLQTITEFKHESPARYEEYSKRYNNTHEYYVKHRKPGEFLTSDNYQHWEEQAQTMTMIGAGKAESKDSLLSIKFSRLTDTQKADLRYHAILAGRGTADGKIILEQSDFEWLDSQDYADIQTMRIESAKKASDIESRTV